MNVSVINEGGKSQGVKAVLGVWGKEGVACLGLLPSGPLVSDL